MADYYTSIEQTRKDMLSALMYPSIILVVAIAVIIFVLVAVVPSFTTMYEGTGSELPGITIFTMNASSFIQKQLVLYRTSPSSYCRCLLVCL